MPNQVTVSSNNVISIVYEGDQTGETANLLHEKVLAEVEKLHALGKPAHIFVDVEKLGNHDSASHMATIDSLKILHFEKLAIIGANPYVKHIGNFILQASGKFNLIKYVQTKEEADAWFAQTDNGERSTTKAIKILVVDGSEEMMTRYRKTFSPEIYEVYGVGTVSAAHTILTAEIPNAIILDLMLSGGDNGFDFLEAIRKDQRTAAIPVIVCSDLAGQESNAKLLGVENYFSKKTLDDKVLLDAIAKLTQK